MSVRISALRAGDVVYDVGRVQSAGSMSGRTAVWRVMIVEVDTENQKVLASWNGNKPKHFYARNGAFSWRRTDPRTKRIAR